MSRKKGSKIEVFNGFIKQVPRAMFYLISGYEKVKIEAEDDISIHDIYDNIVIIEQLKHTNKNVLTNKSCDFWGTFYNWIFNSVNDKKPEKYNSTTYILYVSNKTAAAKDNVKKLLDNIDSDEFSKIFDEIVTDLIKNCSDELKLYLKYLQAHKDVFLKILKKFKIKTPEISISEDLDNLIKLKYEEVYGDSFNDFILKLDGWYHRKITKREDESLKKCEVTQNELEKFKIKFAGFQTKVKFVQNTLTSEELEKLENEFFVEQLNEIEISKDAIQNAKNAYKDWENFQDSDLLEGRVSQEDLNQTYSNLKAHWTDVKFNIPASIYPTEVSKGKYIYSETLKSEVYIDGVEIVGDKNTISRGIHNYMANHPLTHEHSINWHPKYDKLRNSNE